jgi:hypothetical protein
MKFRNIKTGEISEPFFEGEYAYWNDICGIGSRQMLINEFNSLFEPINKLTCRGCNNELDNCTCDVLTTDRPESLEAKVLRDEIKNLRLIDASHRIENGELRERITELEETALNKDEAEALLLALESYVFCLYGNKKLPDWAAKLQKIIDKKG